MIVAQEKTGYYGLSREAARHKKIRRRKIMPVGRRIALTAMILAGFLIGVSITYYYSQVFALGYRLGCLEKELAILRVENNNLDGEVQRLASLDRVESLAINKLGMVKPDSNNVLVVTVSGAIEQTSDSGAGSGNVAGISPAGEEKGRLNRFFVELVNRLENKIWLGRGTGAGLEEGTDANNQYIDPEKNNRSFSYSGVNPSRTDFSPGLASACRGG